MSGACFTSQFRQSKQVCRDENIHCVGYPGSTWRSLRTARHQQLIGKEEKGLRKSRSRERYQSRSLPKPHRGSHSPHQCCPETLWTIHMSTDMPETDKPLKRMGNPNWIKGGASPNPSGRTDKPIAMLARMHAPTALKTLVTYQRMRKPHMPLEYQHHKLSWIGVMGAQPRSVPATPDLQACHRHDR